MSREPVRRWALFLLLVLWGLGYIAVFAWLLRDSRDFITSARAEAVCAAPRSLAAFGQSFGSVENAATLDMRAAGWANPEPWGVWSAEKQAVLVLPVPLALESRAAALLLHVNAPLNDQVPRMTVRVDLAGRPPMRWQLGTDPADTLQRIEFAAGELESTACIEIRFRFEQAYRPMKLGLGPDQRLLGMGLARIRWIDRGSTEASR